MNNNCASTIIKIVDILDSEEFTDEELIRIMISLLSGWVKTKTDNESIAIHLFDLINRNVVDVMSGEGMDHTLLNDSIKLH